MSISLKKLWLDNYVGPDGLCVICENTGKIKTKHGTYCCICPNGRSIKRQMKRHDTPLTADAFRSTLEIEPGAAGLG